MSYLPDLIKLRKEIDMGGEEAPRPKSTKLINPRQAAPDPTFDPLALSKSMMKEIRAKGQAYRERYAAEREAAEMAEAESPTVVVQEAVEPAFKEDPKTDRPSIFGDTKVSFGDDVDIGAASNFLQLMDKTEGGGGYSTLFGHSQNNKFKGVDVSKMTIRQIMDFAAPNGEYGQWVKGQVGRVATPMGRYQFVGTTLKNVANKMGLPDDTVFDKRTQDAMFKFHLADTLSQGDTMKEKVDLLRGQWEGFKNVPTLKLVQLIRKSTDGS